MPALVMLTGYAEAHGKVMTSWYVRAASLKEVGTLSTRRGLSATVP